jgi:Fur family transcriptional regulator, ferric uptake regulator
VKSKMRGRRQVQSRNGPRPQLAAEAVLLGHLARRGLRRSGAREIVAETFLAARDHVSVDELTARVRRRDAGIGQATVYRTLKLLAECGLAAARHFGDGLTRYEPVLEEGHHDHLICTGCGAIVEFENPEIEQLQLGVARRHGFAVDSHRLEIYGRCARCRPGTAGRERA